MQFSPGDVVGGKFRVERTLGEGGMGIVVCATHLALGQLVALKFMQKHALLDPEIRSRFMREARAASKLKSTHAARVLDVGALDDGAPYIVMEYLEGLDLSTLLKKRGRLPAPEAAEYVIQACEALAEAHSHGIIHRDLKPANLFLTTGTTGRPLVKVLDFGVSKVLRDRSLPELPGVDLDSTMPGGKPRPGAFDPGDSVVTRVTDLLGSPNYMAPEQIHSARDADAQSDVWSLGVILYRLVSGIIPFSGGTQEELIYQVTRGPIAPLRDYVATLPAGFDLVVAKCMERDKSRRFASVSELARALAPYAAGSAAPSLERIAILESNGTRVLGAGGVGAGFQAVAPFVRDGVTPTPMGASTPGWTSPSVVVARPAPVATASGSRGPDRGPRYLAIGAGVIVLALVGMAAAVQVNRNRADAAERAEDAPPSATAAPPSATAAPPSATTATIAVSAAPPPTGSSVAVVASATPSTSTTVRYLGGRPKPKGSGGAAASATTPPTPTATGPDIPDTRQ